MIYSFLSLYLPILSLILLTFILVVRDRVIEKRIRRDFYFIIAFLLVTFIWDASLVSGVISAFPISFGTTMVRCILQPMMICFGVDIVRREEKDLFDKKVLFVPITISAVVAIISMASYIKNGKANALLMWSSIAISAIIQIVALICMLLTARKRAKKYNSSEHIVVAVSTVLILISAIFEFTNNDSQIIDIVTATILCVYFFYIEIQIYKRDELTRLLTRHSLMHELAERKHEEFYVSLVDIDEFKKINDKYGHDKGDEALRLVVDVLRETFSKNSKIYRYGGDEFVLLSFNVTKEQIDKQFEEANKILDESDKRISYGCILHEAGGEASEILRQADLFMYEDKRNKKMEDIWDDTTGTYNLKGFIEELDILKKHSRAEKKAIILGTFDVERLGNINAEYGYSEGNFVIAALAEVLRNSMDSGAILGHIGSDSFVVAIKTNPGDESPMIALAESVNAGIVHSPKFNQKEYFVEVCEEHDFMNYDVKSSEKEINRIIGLIKSEKENRRKNSYEKDIDYDEMGIDKEEEKFALSIIDGNMFKYALQPIVRAKDGEIVAYEALMRSDTEPVMSPLTILRHAFKNNRGYDIESATFFNVLKLFNEIKEKMGERRIFLNSIPGNLLVDEDYIKLKEEYPDLMNRIVVEITEQSELTDEELETIRRRQEESGNGIAIDDYGSGSSNTYNLLRIRPEVIKLDRLLICDIDTNTKKQYFVNSIVTFAKENGMQVLAEGVETEAEMKMVIRLHVDYIQGFYLAKPSFDALDNIDSEIKKVIITENMRGISEGKRKIYLANHENYLSLVQVALEEYTGITISSPKMTIVGSRDYEADMYIKIKDGTEVYLTLRDVRLTSVDQLPCIDVGENSHLTIIMEGECAINHRGIHVPKGSRLDIIGSGNLSISTKGHDCYGIGAGYEEEVGEIVFNHSGEVKIRVDGELSSAIGGGIYSSGNGIQVLSGLLDISVASITGVGIGCIEGEMPIKLKDCGVTLDIRVNEGIGIGSLNGIQNIDISNFSIIFAGSGSRVACVGTVQPSGGKMSFYSGSIEGAMSGQYIYLIGAPEGEMDISFKNVRIDIKGEGNAVLALGTVDMKSRVSLEGGTEEIIINSAEPTVFGAQEENVIIKGGMIPVLKVNA